jgi:hypothetical protein
VPAPPRTRPNPAHRLGATTRLSTEPPCSAFMRAWPTEALCTAITFWLSAMVSGESESMMRSVWAQASSARSRAMGVEADPVLEGATFGLGQGLDAAQFLGGRFERFSPHEPNVGLTGGHPQGGVGTSPEKDRWPGEGGVGDHGVVDVEVVTPEIQAALVPASPQDFEELVAAGVALVLVEVVAEAALLDLAGSGDHVQQEATSAHPLEGGGLLCGQRR